MRGLHSPDGRDCGARGGGSRLMIGVQETQVILSLSLLWVGVDTKSCDGPSLMLFPFDEWHFVSTLGFANLFITSCARSASNWPAIKGRRGQPGPCSARRVSVLSPGNSGRIRSSCCRRANTWSGSQGAGGGLRLATRASQRHDAGACRRKSDPSGPGRIQRACRHAIL